MLFSQHAFADGQGALVERLGLLVLPLVGVEVCQVIETASGVGVLGSQHAFVDGQGALEERLGLLVLPLVAVEDGQVIETTSGVGVLGSQHAFVDGQGALVERLGLLVLPLVAVEVGQVSETVCFAERIGSFHLFHNRLCLLIQRLNVFILPTRPEVHSDTIEEVCCFIKGHVVLLDVRDTFQRMEEVPLTQRPGSVFIIGKALIDHAYGTLCPELARCCIHLVFHNLLHETVQTVGLGIDIPVNERVAGQGFERLVQHEWIISCAGKHLRKNGTKVARSLCQQFQWNMVWTQKGAQAQDISSCRLFFHFAEVDRPCRLHRLGVVRGFRLCLVEQGQALLAITGQVVLKAGVLLKDVGAALFQCQRQVAKLFGQLLSCCSLLTLWLIASRSFQEKRHRLFWLHLLHLHRPGNPEHIEDLCTRGQQQMSLSGCIPRKIPFEQCWGVRIVEDEQPVLMLFYPVLDRLKNFIRIRCLLLW